MKINKYSKREYSVLLYFLSIFLMCSLFFVKTNAEHSIEVYVYDFPNFYSLENIKNYFHHTFKAEATIYYRYLNDSYYLDEFLKIVSLLITEGVPIMPPDFCVPCEMEKDWKETYIRYSCPLLLYFRDGNLTSIVISRFEPNILFQAFIYSEEPAKVFLRDDLICSLNNDARIRIEDLLKEKREVSMEFFYLLPIIVMAALIDAVNPCEFFVLIVFLSLVITRLGKKAVLKFGAAYSIAIFIAYFMMGLGLWKLIGYVHEAKMFVVILGLSIGLRSIINFTFGLFGLSIGLRETIGGFLNKKFKRIPKFLSDKAADHLRRFSSNPSSAFLIGVATSIFLLPCTSGPYLIALSLIADLETQTQGLTLLTIYNSIIITPFLAITACIYMLKLEINVLKRRRSIVQRWLSFIGGLLMVTLSLYLLIYHV